MAQGITIRSDDDALVERLRTLEARVTAAGGYLHPTLEIEVAGGDFGIRSDAPEGEPLVRLPPACLIPVDDVDLQIDGNDIVAAAVGTSLSAVQRELLDDMLGLFNAAGKLAQHQAALPWVAAADEPRLLDRLYAGRPDAPKVARFYDLARRQEHRQLLLDSFIGSRTLQYRGAPETSPIRVLMPFIDFFNHHAAAPPFARDGDALVVNCARPSSGSRECFVRYNRMDALDAFLTYGFVDRSPRFLRSVPVDVEIDGVGTLQIQGRVAQPRRKVLPSGLQFLRGFVPRFQKEGEDRIVAAELLIPTHSVHKLLGGALTVILRNLDPTLDGARLVAALEQVTATVLRANEIYYGELEIALREVSERKRTRAVYAQIDALLETQAERLTAIRNALSLNQNGLAAGPGAA